jgi:voltage-gated potassium channel
MPLLYSLFRTVSMRAYRSATKSTPAMLSWIFAVWFFHVIAMMWLEGMSFNDANWLTFTTIMTVGYGDLSASTVWGRIATIVLLYIGGIFVLATAVNSLIETKTESAALKLAGKWRWKLEDHILIVSPLGNETDSYYARMVREVRTFEGWDDVGIQILSPCFEHIPEVLKKEGVVHYKGTGTQVELEACDYDKARAVVVLGYTRAKESDALVFDIVSRIPKDIFVVAECVDDASRDRFRNVGADVVVRPLRGYPEMISRGITAPGTEYIMEEMFSSSGKVVKRIDLPELTEIDLPATTTTFCEQRIGVLVGIHNNGIEVSPLGKSCLADAIFVLVDEGVTKQMAREAVVLV